MPESAAAVHLATAHDAFRKQVAPEMTAGAFIARICNQGGVLPEEKVEGNPWHMPCSWLGDTSERALLREDRIKQDRARLGWRQSSYLIIVPYPREADFDRRIGACPDDEAGAFLRAELAAAGVDLRETVMSYVCRFQLPSTVRHYRPRHEKDNLVYLQEDIRQIRPSVIIACGAASVKALFGKNTKLDSVRGDVLKFQLDGVEYPVVTTASHLAFLGGYANISVFRHELRRAVRIASHASTVEHAAVDYRVIDSVEGVAALCDEICASGTTKIAFDTEFGNDFAREEYSYTISVQLCWAPGKVAFIKLRDQTPMDAPALELPSVEEWINTPALSHYARPLKAVSPAAARKYAAWCARRQREALGAEGRDYSITRDGVRWKHGVKFLSDEQEREIWRLLQELLLDRRWRLCGQHMRVDVEQFHRNGYPIDERVEDGEDTMLKHHLLYGDEDQGLDHLVRKYLPDHGAYWRELEEWLDANSREKRLRFGYRDVPFDILIPYAQKDADLTWRVDELIDLELVQKPKLHQLYHAHVAPTSLFLLDLQRKGILIDEPRRAELRAAYEPVYEKMLGDLREKIHWPTFNPRSQKQMASLLFGRCRYRDKALYKWADGTKRVLPEGVRGLNLRPVFNTDKYPRMWDQIVEEDAESQHSPSTKAAALEILQHEHPDIEELRLLKHLSVVGKFLSDYLSPQVVNEFGVPEGGKGFHNNIWRDGRVRTHLSQLTQTGRYSSSAANLQVKPKKQESAAFAALVDFYHGVSVEEYRRRTDPEYTGEDRIEPKDHITVPKYASCFIARPGYCLIEADFKAAEMWTWAYCSGDAELIRVCEMGRDLHCETAVTAFNLPPLADLPSVLALLESGQRKAYDEWCEGVKESFGDLRSAAKMVGFGIMYGRQSGALMREINKVVAVPVTREDTQCIIDEGFARRFPVAWKWLEQNADSAVENECIENIFGRMRYFQGVSQLSEREKAATRREAKNAPIQGAVADLLSKAGVQFYRFLKRTDIGRSLDMDVLLPVHDAFLFEVRIGHVVKALKLIDLCMSRGNCFPGTKRYLRIDVGVMPHRWSDKPFNPEKKGDIDKFLAQYG